MLVIREAQMEAFRRLRTEEFEDKLAQRLLQQFPRECARLGGEREVIAFAAGAVKRLGEHGVDTEGGVTIMAGVMLRFGLALEQSPLRNWAMNLLESKDAPGEGRARAVWEKHLQLDLP
jgi:hypothetical protein